MPKLTELHTSTVYPIVTAEDIALHEAEFINELVPGVLNQPDVFDNLGYRVLPHQYDGEE